MTASRFVRAALAPIATLAAACCASPAYANSSPTTGADFYRLSSSRPALSVAAPGLLANDTDPDNDPLTALPIRDPDWGTVRIRRDGSFRYVPDPGHPGYDSFDYLASDGNSLTTWGHAYITLTRPPVAHEDEFAALTRVKRTLAAPGVLENDFAPEGHAELRRPPKHGTVKLHPDGAVDYRSDPGYVGRDRFRYAVVVEGEPHSTALAWIRVKASNRRPTAVPDDFSTPEDTSLEVAPPGVLANDTDPDGDPLTALPVTDPYGEGFFLWGDGSFEYAPPINYDSPVNFTYRVSDGLALSDPATSTIEIPAVNDPPYAEGDDYELFGAGGWISRLPACSPTTTTRLRAMP